MKNPQPQVVQVQKGCFESCGEALQSCGCVLMLLPIVIALLIFVIGPVLFGGENIAELLSALLAN